MLDTATVVSAIRSESGASAEIVRRTFLGHVTILADYKLICEYRDVGLRRQHVAASGKTSREVRELIDLLESVAVPVIVEMQVRPLSQDQNDDMVLDVAINGDAQAVVTNNLKHFTLAAERFGIEVLTPRDFLLRLKGPVPCQRA